MILLGPRRPSAISFSQAAPINTSNVATFGGALTLNDLVIFLHRYANAAHDVAPSGFSTLGFTDGGPSSTLSAGYAVGGDTVFTGPDLTTDRCCALAYRGCRISQATNISPANAGGASTTGTFPTLALKNPGRSWVLGLSVSGTGNLASATTAPQWRSGSGIASNFLNIVDSGGPVSVWTGQTITYGVSTLWTCWSLEIMSL